MGWSNVGAAVLQAQEVILVDSNGNVDGSLDGVNGLVLYGGGSANDPGLTINGSGDLVWGGDASLTHDPSIEIGAIFDDNLVDHPAAIFNSGATDAGQKACYLTVYGADSTGAVRGGVCVSQGYLVGSDPTVSGNPPITPESWHIMTLQNSWTSGSGSGFDSPAYRIDALGNVQLKGLALAGTKTNGTVVATLPVGYRPAVIRQIICSADSNISPFLCILHINTNGTITINGLGSGDAIGLDGLFYSLT